MKLALLGLVQGLTEFLPVSSKGHLALGEMLLGVQLQGATGASTEVALHAGTLVAVLLYVRDDVRRILRCLWPAGGAAAEATRRTRSLLLWVAIATVPAAVVGYLFQDRLEQHFDDPRATGIGFLFTASLLLLSSRFRNGTRNATEIGVAAAIGIGLFQVMALFPGVSRSGTTIVAGMLLGAIPVEAARFSFLMAIPITGGAMLLKSGDILHATRDELLALGVGIVSAFVFGLIALHLLTTVLRRGRFTAFAWYLIPMGCLVLVWANRGGSS